jgi:hypothetical protein
LICSNDIYFNLNKDYYILNKILLALQWWPHISTIILERKFFYEINANKITNLRYAGDGDLLLKLASKKTLFVLRQNLVTCHYFKKKYNSHGLSSDVQKMNRGEISVLKNNSSGFDSYESDGDLPRHSHHRRGRPFSELRKQV